jgi:hypothetical protein
VFSLKKKREIRRNKKKKKKKKGEKLVGQNGEGVSGLGLR